MRETFGNNFIHPAPAPDSIFKYEDEDDFYEYVPEEEEEEEDGDEETELKVRFRIPAYFEKPLTITIPRDSNLQDIKDELSDVFVDCIHNAIPKNIDDYSVVPRYDDTCIKIIKSYDDEFDDFVDEEWIVGY